MLHGRTGRLGLAVCAAVLTAGCSTAPSAGPAAVTSSPRAPASTPSPVADATRDPATPLAASRPLRLRVPSIGVSTELVDLGLRADRTLEVPPGAFPAGWYTGGPAPGELGPAVLAGHVDYGGRAGVFADLADLEPGAEVVVERQDGSAAVFRVTRVDRVGKAAFPTSAVYGDLDHAGLRLITCGGDFSRRTGSYEDNVIAYAELVRST